MHTTAKGSTRRKLYIYSYTVNLRGSHSKDWPCEAVHAIALGQARPRFAAINVNLRVHSNHATFTINNILHIYVWRLRAHEMFPAENCRCFDPASGFQSKEIRGWKDVPLFFFRISKILCGWMLRSLTLPSISSPYGNPTKRVIFKFLNITRWLNILTYVKESLRKWRVSLFINSFISLHT